MRKLKAPPSTLPQNETAALYGAAKFGVLPAYPWICSHGIRMHAPPPLMYKARHTCQLIGGAAAGNI